LPLLEKKKEVVFGGTIQLRQDVSIKIKQRAQYRRSRRSRQLRKGWVVGSVRALKEKVMTLRTKEDSNFPVSYKKSQLHYCKLNAG